jgi:type III restriction enzyme
VAARTQADDVFARILKGVGIERVPEGMETVLRQAISLLDHASRSRMTDFGHAFQPLLHPLDKYALDILAKQLSPRIPASPSEQYSYFNPYLDGRPQRQKILLEKYQRYLQNNLTSDRAMQRLGTLLFCLDYARHGGWGAAGVWRDVQETFSGPEMLRLYGLLEAVNAFRNTRVAHVDAPLSNADEAWKAMREWVQCLSLMYEIAHRAVE